MLDSACTLRSSHMSRCTHQIRCQHALEHEEICVRELCECLEQYLCRHCPAGPGRGKLVELQQRQVGLKVITITITLECDIFFESLYDLRVVPTMRGVKEKIHTGRKPKQKWCLIPDIGSFFQIVNCVQHMVAMKIDLAPLQYDKRGKIYGQF